MKNIRIFFGNPPVPVVKLWRNAFAQSTEGIFLLYLITSVIVESVRNNSLTYSWIEILLMVVTMGTIRRYYIRHKRIYLMVFENVWHRLNRYMAAPSDAVDKKIQALTDQALEARRNGHLPGFAAYLSSADYTRLESISQKIVETAGSKGRYWDTFILICIVSYAIVTIGTMIKDML
ncbi:hypothetical protein SAMN05216582_12348 [Selenomonas ruminantium]|uniref:Uncharacterized protein n=1 Tax=Selenomonas ruminantium TaxID=971 RepID=A0A1M6W9T2_SELRU|nr:hypothetical protein SAMN05216582_12348 [Selenomonas ruminantium]